MNGNDPEALGEFLRARARYARRTCERKGQVSRVDALCWYLSKVNHATSRQVKVFMTAFRGVMPRYSTRDKKTGSYEMKPGFERAYALLNTAYGGVGMGFEGRLRVCMTGPHYGPVAPLYRPLPRHYACTIAGLRRAARVEAYVDSRR